MSAAAVLVINPYEIEQIRQRKVSPLSKFDEIAARLRRAAKLVKEKWDNFSDEDREFLKQLAYELIEPPKRDWLYLVRLIRAKISWHFMSTSEQEAFKSCIEALDVLVENILDAVERQDPGYQAVLSDTLEQLYSSETESKVIEVEETREWLRNLSDQAVGEV